MIKSELELPTFTIFTHAKDLIENKFADVMSIRDSFCNLKSREALRASEKKVYDLRTGEI